MTDSPPPIPPPYWVKLREFLEERQTGSITLHVQEGRILRLDMLVVWRDADLIPQ
jgi:Uncharacterized small protein (DUF2292)